MLRYIPVGSPVVARLSLAHIDPRHAKAFLALMYTARSGKVAGEVDELVISAYRGRRVADDLDHARAANGVGIIVYRVRSF